MWYDGEGTGGSVWSGVSLVLSNIATAVTAGVGAWFLSRRKLSGDSAAIFADKAGSELLKTLLDERKVLTAEKNAAQSAAMEMIKQRTADAEAIARFQTENAYLKARTDHCEEAAVKADKRVTEVEERMRATTEQLMLAQMRVRNLYAEVSRLDPMAAARVVKEQMEMNVVVAAEAVVTQSKEAHSGDSPN